LKNEVFEDLKKKEREKKWNPRKPNNVDPFTESGSFLKWGEGSAFEKWEICECM
jgi:hypothetical protein